jgi:hypothetical protein
MTVEREPDASIAIRCMIDRIRARGGVVRFKVRERANAPGPVYGNTRATP